MQSLGRGTGKKGEKKERNHSSNQQWVVLHTVWWNLSRPAEDTCKHLVKGRHNLCTYKEPKCDIQASLLLLMSITLCVQELRCFMKRVVMCPGFQKRITKREMLTTFGLKASDMPLEEGVYSKLITREVIEQAKNGR